MQCGTWSVRYRTYLVVCKIGQIISVLADQTGVPMSYARLYLDGSKSWWALGRCDACQSVHRYPLADAARWPMACLTCGRKLDVRQGVREEMDDRPDIPPEIRSTLAAPQHISRHLGPA